MSRVCQVTGKRVQSGTTSRTTTTKPVVVPPQHCTSAASGSPVRTVGVKLRVSAAAMRTIDKNGIDVVLSDLRAPRGEKV